MIDNYLALLSNKYLLLCGIVACNLGRLGFSGSLQVVGLLYSSHTTPRRSGRLETREIATTRLLRILLEQVQEVQVDITCRI